LPIKSEALNLHPSPKNHSNLFVTRSGKINQVGARIGIPSPLICATCDIHAMSEEALKNKQIQIAGT